MGFYLCVTGTYTPKQWGGSTDEDWSVPTTNEETEEKKKVKDVTSKKK